jgi:TPR repeat protein
MKKEKVSRRRRVKKVKMSRRNNTRKGGSSASASASASRAAKLKKLLGTPDGPESGMFKLLRTRLFKDPTAIVSPPRHVADAMHRALYSRVKMKRVENELFKRAERLHATSFRYCNFNNVAMCSLAKCTASNLAAVKDLQDSMEMGNFQARALLADMLLNGRTVGVNKNVREAVAMVEHVEHPDCQGVLAHHYFNGGIKAGHSLAKQSAAAKSKYGQYVLGLYEQRDRNVKKASECFSLAAAQNYEEAQIALSECQSDRGEALRLLKLAAEQGNNHAFYSIAELHRRSSEQLHDQLRAMDWFKLATDAEHPWGRDSLSALSDKYRDYRNYRG